MPPTNDDPRQGYTGYQKDGESGLDFAQARYYNSAHGRFTSVDPLTASASIRNPQTFNRYSYVLNSPYKFSDPLGLLPMGTRSGDSGCTAENSSCSDDWGTHEFSEDVPEAQPTNEGVADNQTTASADDSQQDAQDAEPPPPAMWIEATIGSTVYFPTHGEIRESVEKVPLNEAQKKILANLWKNNFPQQLDSEISAIADEKFGKEDITGKEREKGASNEVTFGAELSKDLKLNVDKTIGSNVGEKELIKVDSGRDASKSRFTSMAKANANAITALQKTSINYQSKNLAIKGRMSLSTATSLVNAQNEIGKTQASELATAATKSLE